MLTRSVPLSYRFRDKREFQSKMHLTPASKLIPNFISHSDKLLYHCCRRHLGQRGRFIQYTHCYQQYKTVFIHGQSVIGTYYHPGLKILPLWTVSRTDYPSVITKLVLSPPRCDTHLGETSIIQIQIQIHTNGLYPSHTVSEINGNFSRKLQNFPTLCI